MPFKYPSLAPIGGLRLPHDSNQTAAPDWCLSDQFVAALANQSERGAGADQARGVPMVRSDARRRYRPARMHAGGRDATATASWPRPGRVLAALQEPVSHVTSERAREP